jgi:hypothetical protein
MYTSLYIYACETWVLTGKDELTILIWERKVLIRIFGPICERIYYRMRINEVVYRIYKELDLITIIKSLRLKKLGHVNRMEDHRQPKSISGCGRRRGKSRKVAG